MDSDPNSKDQPTKPNNPEPIARALKYDNEQVNILIKSPMKSGFRSRSRNMERSNNENIEPEGTPNSMLMSFGNSPLENKLAFPRTPITLKTEMPIFDRRETKPHDSPFTAFCRDYQQMNQSPFVSDSPGLLKQPVFSSSMLAYKTPSPLKYSLYDHPAQSPYSTQKKCIHKLEFSGSKVSLKSRKEGISIEFDQQYNEEQYNDPEAFSKVLSCNEKLEVPVKNEEQDKKSTVVSFSSSNYYNSNVDPTNNPFSEAEYKQTKKQVYQVKREESPERRNQFQQHHIEDRNQTPGSSQKGSKKIKLEFMNSFSGKNSKLDNMMIKREQMYDSQDYGSQMEDEQLRRNVELSQYEDEANKKVCCNCKKSKCLKLYCDCFAKGDYCTKECNCINCYNNPKFEDERTKAMNGILERNPGAFKPKFNKTDTPTKIDENGRLRHIRGCNCKKSGCLKKYCECFQAGIKCTEFCKCEACKNMDNPQQPFKRQQPYYGNSYHQQQSASYEDEDEKYSSAIKMEHPQSSSHNVKRQRKLVDDHKKYKHEYSDEEDEDDQQERDLKKYSQPRKQHQIGNFNSFQTPNLLTDLISTSNSSKKKSTSNSNTLDDHTAYKNPASSSKKEDLNLSSKIKEKKGTTSITLKSINSDIKKPLKFDNSPSPKKTSIVEGRRKRQTKGFGRINPDEYEM